MEIIEVKQNWPDDSMRIDLTLGNVCNYSCWYCWPGCHEGTNKWPEFTLFVTNLSHLLDHYLKNTNKKKFEFHIMGGEITHWPKFFDLIEFLKERYNCIFILTTNASKKIEWWEKTTPYLDYVYISSHHQFCDAYHIRQVADLLYKRNTMVNVIVLMDPFEWNKCMDHVEIYKKSKYKWSIRYLEIIHDTVNYTQEQKKVLSTLRARKPNLWWFLKNNKSHRSNVKVVDTNNKVHKVSDEKIILERMNNFKGWECSVGVNWIAVTTNGTVSAICSNGLYANNEKFNIFETDFINKFNPKIQPTTCKMDACWCMFEANMPKRKVIPIYAN
jgi:organic radical activating enzyme